MKISSMLSSGGRTFSFEFYPPKKEEDIPALKSAIAELKSLGPDFVSITLSQKYMPKWSFASISNTLALSGVLKHEFSLEVMAHLTTEIIRDRQTLDETLKLVKILGLENVLALRGDLAPDREGERCFSYASDLVPAVKSGGDFCVGVAAYPEKHPEAPSLEEDVRRLKQKLDAGGEFAITQVFFDNEAFFRFRDAAAAAGVTAPVIPGLMPLTSLRQRDNFVAGQGISVPAALSAGLEKHGGDKEALFAFGLDYAVKQAEELLAAGVPGLHFYTFNRSRATREVFRLLNPARAA
jgi:methylenetetrahydrofolate reductase (NADPH)